ncbi:MAG: YicC/YloC family endoribonuclease [Burkholderiales bacterium]|nr:YicC family protein [Burkholderiales bacterium]MDQ3195472.1 YicC family protein [Pseudomonadota bacterium]
MPDSARSGVYSMTGYAAAGSELPGGALAIDLRAVNHRYLDIQFRMPDELRQFEPALREAIASRLQRGKVDCRISLTAPASATSAEPRLNRELLQQLIALQRDVRTVSAAARELSVGEILRWPGVMATDTLTLEALRESCLALLRKVLDEFEAARRREGDKLTAMLLDRVSRMEHRAAEVAPRFPQMIAAYQDKLANRVREAALAVDDDRIRQELVMFIAKIDVDEELTRLGAHLAEIRRILERGGAVGKRLDFLMQELNREANTLGSKSIDVEVSKISMDLKLLIEQMREQIQNLE